VCIPDIMLSKVCCLGAGYVGGSTLSIIAHYCPEIQVTVVDTCDEQIKMWNSDTLPIYEPGLDEIVKLHRGKNLHFSSDIDKAIDEAEMIFISVNTPTKNWGLGKGRATDLTNLEAAARRIAKVSRQPKVIVEKSTVPVKAAETTSTILQFEAKSRRNISSLTITTNNNDNKLNEFVVLSNPEFLAEGTAVNDLCNPDRILIGGDSHSSSGKLAIEISINAISAICEQTSADIKEVSKAIGADHRIGPYFLNASLGFGGSCFRKDILSLMYISETLNLPEVASYCLNLHFINAFFTCIHIIIVFFSLKNIRDSPVIPLCNQLLQEQAELAIYDPKALHKQIESDLLINNNKDSFSQFVHICSTPEEAVTNAYAILICTDWKCFQEYDYAKFYRLMTKPARIFDGRIILNHKQLSQIGFIVEAIGIASESFTMNGYVE
ncbi:UDPglucose 6-dehydrogenase, partial [Schistosoma bovis]